MKILVTGTAGFIGSAVAIKLLERGEDVVGLDNLNDYYDVNLKKARLARFLDHPSYHHVHADLSDRAAMEALFAEHKPERVVNLAAQAGVRTAAKNPHVYVSSNVRDSCTFSRAAGTAVLSISSSPRRDSVYGANTEMPFSEHHSAEHPLTLYAAPYRLFNIRSPATVELMGYIEVLEKCLGRKAQMEMRLSRPELYPIQKLTSAI